MNPVLTYAEINALLNRSAPITVRRVLPKDFIEFYVRHHLQEIESMMDSFKAILTFPTTERQLPQLIKVKIESQLLKDLSECEGKIKGEVNDLLRRTAQRGVLQSSIMLNVLSARAFPFCLLNTMTFEPETKIYIPCYVILWAQHESKDQPIKVWLELAPRYEEHWKYLPLSQRRSTQQIVRFPMGQVDFCAFNTVVSVILHNIPSDAEATLSGKSRKQIMQELVDLRKRLVRQDGQKGNFLHITWTSHELPGSKFLPIQEAGFI